MELVLFECLVRRTCALAARALNFAVTVMAGLLCLFSSYLLRLPYRLVVVCSGRCRVTAVSRKLVDPWHGIGALARWQSDRQAHIIAQIFQCIIFGCVIHSSHSLAIRFNGVSSLGPQQCVLCK